MEIKTFYESVGGENTFTRLTHLFYCEVKQNEILMPLYPPEDLAGAERRLKLFLIQFWGGPSTYSSERGHPRLRLRHFPFKISVTESNAWLSCMKQALKTIQTEGLINQNQYHTFWESFSKTARALINNA